MVGAGVEACGTCSMTQAEASMSDGGGPRGEGPRGEYVGGGESVAADWKRASTLGASSALSPSPAEDVTARAATVCATAAVGAATIAGAGANASASSIVWIEIKAHPGSGEGEQLPSEAMGGIGVAVMGDIVESGELIELRDAGDASVADGCGALAPEAAVPPEATAAAEPSVTSDALGAVAAVRLGVVGSATISAAAAHSASARFAAVAAVMCLSAIAAVATVETPEDVLRRWYPAQCGLSDGCGANSSVGKRPGGGSPGDTGRGGPGGKGGCGWAVSKWPGGGSSRGGMAGIEGRYRGDCGEGTRRGSSPGG